MSKQAIKDARKQIGVAFKAYRLEVKKHKLFGKQASIKAALDEIGVANRQINVICFESKAQRINVRVGV